MEKFQIGIRLELDLLERLDRAAKTLAPPITLTRSDAVRILLLRALEEHEASLPPSKQQTGPEELPL